MPLRLGGRVKLARIGNDKYTALGRKLEERAMQESGTELLEDGQSKEITCEALAGAVLLDFELTGKDDKPLKYTPELAKELLLEFPDFLAEVLEKANAMENFRVKRLQKDVKN